MEISKGKRKHRRFSLIRLLFDDEETNGRYLFANGLNGLNRLNGLTYMCVSVTLEMPALK
jgi:hypothetical protein